MSRSRSVTAAATFATVLLAAVLGTGAQEPSTRPSRPPTTQRAEGRTWERGPGAPGQAERPPTLERSMKQMNAIVKGIDRQIDDPSKDASTLSLVNGLQAATINAKNLYPDDIGEKTGDEKTKAIAEYRARMIAVLRTELELEENLLSGDRKAAREALAKLADNRKEGHKAYGVDDEHHH